MAIFWLISWFWWSSEPSRCSAVARSSPSASLTCPRSPTSPVECASDSPWASWAACSHFLAGTKSWLQPRSTPETCNESVRKGWSQLYLILQRVSLVVCWPFCAHLDCCFSILSRKAESTKNQESTSLQNRCSLLFHSTWSAKIRYWCSHGRRSATCWPSSGQTDPITRPSQWDSCWNWPHPPAKARAAIETVRASSWRDRWKVNKVSWRCTLQQRGRCSQWLVQRLVNWCVLYN